jgi:hypothetical protein
MPLMTLRLYRRWKERRSRARDRYAEMSEEQREAIGRYQHRENLGPGATNVAPDTYTRRR